ncbi:DUF4340 domain-containing protein [Candidatus Thiosymbion oneisti]|uniref:DUF4340 domain-containing protein n=1 Tax=Candidatus Thiosymbion oneisti TaxID=589554 RepID=UPI00106060DD|nr:DUF4340 domain-containing protein [Candidatus Thiosymbion oneisti]
MQTTTEIQRDTAPAEGVAEAPLPPGEGLGRGSQKARGDQRAKIGASLTNRNRSAFFSPLVLGLGALLVLQLLVAFLLGVGEQEMGPAESQGPLLAFDPEQVTGIRIQSLDGEPVLVTKTQDGWIIPALQDLPAAKHKVTGLLAKLAGLRKGLPVATSAAALKRFKVADQTFERKLVLERGDDPSAILYLGDSPGFRRLLVRADGDQAVYEAELGLFDAPDQPDNWSDRTLLHLKPEAVQRLTFAGLTLERTDDHWRLTDLAEGEEQDQQAVKDRVRALTNIDFLGVLVNGDGPAVDAESTPLELEATLADGETVRYRITKLAEGKDYLLEASNRPQRFTLAGYVVEGLTDLSRSDLLKKPEEAEESVEDTSTESSAATDDKASEEEGAKEISTESPAAGR